MYITKRLSRHATKQPRRNHEVMTENKAKACIPRQNIVLFVDFSFILLSETIITLMNKINAFAKVY